MADTNALRRPGATEPRRRWIALVVIAVAQLMTALDATIVNIALPSTQRALGFTDADRQWVITAYTLAFAGLLLLGGRIADRYGRRRAFIGGLVGFATASAVAGAAPDLGVLVAGRAFQGAFAAVLAPTALSLIAVTFTEARERGRAFAVYGAVASSGAAVGLILGGTLTEYLDWRWCLYVNVLIAGAALVAGRIVLPDPPAGRASAIPAGSAALIAAGLAALVYGCSQAAAHGWTAGRVVGPIVAGLAACAGFLIAQRRSRAPMLPPVLLADRDRLGAYLAVATGVIGSFGIFLMLTYHFQAVLGYSPLVAGLAFLPLTVSVSVSGYVVAGLVHRLPPRALIGSGLLLATAGLVLVGRLSVGSGYLTMILPAEVLVGAGMGGIFTPAINVVTARVDPRDAGVAAAVANTAMQVGGSIGVAVLNTVAITATRGYLGAHHAPGAARLALVHGYATAAEVAAAVLACTAVIALVGIRAGRPARHPSAAAPARSGADARTESA